MTLGCVLEACYNSGRLILITASIKKQIRGKAFRKSLSLSVKYFPESLVKMSGFLFWKRLL